MAHHDSDTAVNQERRDFLGLTATAVGCVGCIGAGYAVVRTLQPAADTLAMASTEVDISKIPVGGSTTVMWRGKPVFVRRRTAEEILKASTIPPEGRDPQADKDRVKKPEWLVVVGVCTHLGCVPGGQKVSENRGDYGGYFCPCHGSHYDTSGRIMKGPAPKNLEVPPYTFLNDKTIKIG
jgi:ubiquinol-cytochrome c reductase iron-sulfur subunit